MAVGPHRSHLLAGLQRAHAQHWPAVLGLHPGITTLQNAVGVVGLQALLGGAQAQRLGPQALGHGTLQALLQALRRFSQALAAQQHGALQTSAQGIQALHLALQATRWLAQAQGQRVQALSLGLQRTLQRTAHQA